MKIRYVTTVFAIAVLLALLQAWPEETGLVRIAPLAQLPGDNLHPDFTNSNHGLDYSGTRGLWFAWDVGKTTQRNIYVSQYDRQTEGWCDPVAITLDSTLNQNADIELFGDSVLVVWESNRRGNFDLMYSLFDGNYWSEPAFVTSNSADDRKPVLHSMYRYYGPWKREAMLAWEREGQILWSRFDGQSWSPPAPMPGDAESTRRPDIGGGYGFPFMVWEGRCQNNWDLYGSWFLPDSNRWCTSLRLTNDPGEDRNPKVAHAYVYYVPVVYAYSGSANIVWQTNRDGNWEIYMGILWISEGGSLTQLENLSQHDSSDVDLDAQLIPYGDCPIVVAAWGSNRTGFEDIYLNDLYAIGAQGNVTADSIPDAHPVLSQTAGLYYWLAWERLRSDHWEIWGMRVTIFTDEVVQIGTESVPVGFQLTQNYPNPFNAETVIRYRLPQPSFVILEIYNLLGQRVRALVKGWKRAGNYQVRWNGSSDSGKVLPSGMYFYRIKAGRWFETHKAILTR